MHQIGLRLVVRYGHFVDLLLTQDHANQILTRYKSRDYQIKDQWVIEGVDLRGIVYAVAIEWIMGMHTIPIEAPKASPGTPILQTNRSGIL